MGAVTRLVSDACEQHTRRAFFVKKLCIVMKANVYVVAL